LAEWDVLRLVVHVLSAPRDGDTEETENTEME
jgi:hypothetical protein